MNIKEEIDKLLKNYLKYAKSKNISEEVNSSVKIICANLGDIFSNIENTMDENQKYWILQEIKDQIEEIKKEYLSAFK